MKQDIDALLAIMARLRDPQDGCPWDVQQTFSSVAPYTIEEAYEVADAIDRGDLDDLRDELGDLLLQVVFHSQMADEQGAFDWHDVVAGICGKMTRRHPHVFRDQPLASAAEVKQHWEATKERERAERGADSLMDGVARGLPELQRAVKLQKRAARVGFDWPGPEPVLDKLEEEITELREAMASADAAHVEEEVGDLLFAVVNLARQLSVEPATALRLANAKFERRFRAIERAAGDRQALDGMSPEDMEALWRQAKRAEARGHE